MLPSHTPSGVSSGKHAKAFFLVPFQFDREKEKSSMIPVDFSTSVSLLADITQADTVPSCPASQSLGLVCLSMHLQLTMDTHTSMSMLGKLVRAHAESEAFHAKHACFFS